MFQVESFDVKKFDAILARGLSAGLGNRESLICVNAAVCLVLGLPHGDDPSPDGSPCEGRAPRSFKIGLNDAPWSSPEARAKGMRDIGLAVLGSAGVVDDVAFAKAIAKRTIQVLIPKLFRELFHGNAALLALADRCEKEGSYAAARAAYADAAEAASYADDASADATCAAEAAADATEAAARASCATDASADATYAAARAADAADAACAAKPNPDEYLNLSAQLALEVLRELGSPGIALLGGI